MNWKFVGRTRLVLKKVLIIGMTSGVGGVETFISNLLNRLDKKKFEVDLLLFQEPNEKYINILKRANNIYYVHSIKKNPGKYFIDILRFYKNHKYDIIHLNESTAKLFVYCWPSTFVKHTKLIVHSHNGGGKRLFHIILRPFQNSAAYGFWSCSIAASRWMFGKRRVRNNTIKIIKNGVNIDKYLFSSSIRDEYRKKMNIKKDTRVIGSIARFEIQKNHTFILDVFNDYLKRDKNALLILVGDGSLKKTVEEKTLRLGIENKVMFLGNRDDVCNLLQVFDVLLMPSLYEGLPFIGLEAQAASLPIVASSSVDKNLKITKYVHFLNLKDNLNKWSNVIENSINSFTDIRINSREYTKRKFIESHYDLNETVNRIENLYCEM